MSTKFYNRNWRMPNSWNGSNDNNNKVSNYSMSFDGGSSEQIEVSDDSDIDFTSAFSYSMWFKTTSSSNSYIIQHVGKFLIQIVPGTGTYGRVRLKVSDGSGNNTNVDYLPSTNVIVDGNWHHIVITSDGTNSANGLKMYYDKTVVAQNTQTNSGTNPATQSLYIGSGETTNFFTGSIDHVAGFDYALLQDDVNSLYGSSTSGVGNPMAISLKPKAYYPIGDYAAFNGSEYLVNNGALSDYVFDFDGTDYIDCGNDSSLQITGALTVSTWFKILNNSGNRVLLARDTGSTQRNWSLFISTTGTLKLLIRNNTDTAYNTVESPSAYDDGKWHHAAFVYTPSTSLILYVNGVAVDTNTTSITPSINNETANFTIGAYSINQGYTGDRWTGEMSNIALWNTALTDGTGGTPNQISELYNNGTPYMGTQPQSSNLQAWWKLDASATFDNSNWSIPNALSSCLQSFNFRRRNSSQNGRVDISNNFSFPNKISVSTWFNYPTNASTNTQYIIAQDNPSSDRRWSLGFNTSNKLFARIYNTDNTQTSYFTGTTVVKDSRWHQVVLVYDGTSNANGIKMFLDGKLEAQATASGTGLHTGSALMTTIGNASVSGQYGPLFDCNLSNVQLWDTDLTYGTVTSVGDVAGGQVSTLYNNGIPLTTAIATNNLKGWYKLDNTATWTDSGSSSWPFGYYSIPDASGNGNTGISSNMAKESLVFGEVSSLNGISSGMNAANLVQSNLNTTTTYSRYALNFDGTGDKITLNSSINTGNNYSVSFWLNPENVSSGNSYIFSDSTTSPYKGLALDQGSGTAGGFGNFYYYNGSVNKVNNTAILGDVWSHIVITFHVTGREINFYVNGVLDKTLSFVSNIGTLINEFGIRTTGNAYNGDLSNISIWNTTLISPQITELYNQGKPGNLNNHSAYSSLVSWWQLGENMSFVGSGAQGSGGTEWIVLDEKGSNNGTGANLAPAEDAIVNGVGTSGNGLSDGMGGADNIIGDAPYSTANAVSYGMGVDARVKNGEIFQPFQMQFEVASGVSKTITILGVNGASFYIDWGDGFTETNTGSNNRLVSHTYNDGTYNDVTNPTVSIGSESDTGPLSRLKFRGGSGPELLDIKNWGQSKWTNFADAFRTCNNPAFQISATNTPDLSLLTAPNTSYFSTMFYQSTINSSNLINWDVSNVQKFNSMFYGASQFNQDISGWDVSSATSMLSLFKSAPNFNQDISGWDVSNVSVFQEMFYNASSFNQDISSWDVSSATTMFQMFRSASSFNQDISGWNTSLVTNMERVFQAASQFNQNLNSWNVSNVTNMLAMFWQASNFNQNLSDWQITSLSNARLVFNSSAMTTENYTDTIVGWAVYVYNNSGTPSSVNMTSNSKTFDGTRTSDYASGQTYATKYGSNWTATGWSDAQDAFDYLTTTLSWTIN